jgi:microsomal epoxide hydrolase
MLGLALSGTGACMRSDATSEPRPMRAETFTVSVPKQKLDEVMRRVRAYKWHDGPSDAAWKYGIDPRYLNDLVAHWATGYDWRAAERAINRVRHFRANVDDQQVAFIYEKGSGPHPQPLLLLHGWPYSSYSFLEVVEPLAHPERFGGQVEDAFDVVVPDLPGFGFSPAPRQLRGLRFAAEQLRRLMTEVLGYGKFIVHGGDFGDVAGVWMAFDHPQNVLGLHESQLAFRDADAAFGSGQITGSATAAERAFMKRELENGKQQSAYQMLQSTRPETLAAALMDSPVGQAAWIVEKFYYWTDRTNKAFPQIHSMDQLLSEVMYYVVTDSFETSLRPYVALASLDEEKGVLPRGRSIVVPVAFAVFPNDALAVVPPRSLMERSRANIVQWSEMPRGGHFPMLEEPQLLIEDLRKFGRYLRAHASAAML